MKIIRNTLLGRTALYLGMLLVVVQGLWFATAQYLIITRLGPVYENQIVDMVAMAKSVIEAQGDHNSPQQLKFPALKSLEIFSDSYPRPELVTPAVYDIPGDLTEVLQERFGDSSISLKEKNAEISWIRFPANGKLYWLKCPLSPTQSISWAKFVFVWLEIATAVGGAYLIVFRLTKKLRYVTNAAKAIGRGDPPETLEVSGPEEIRSLCEGFNQMSRDLIKLEADRRLMLAGISHDLRTPLTRMRIAVELASSDIEQAMVQDINDMDAILQQFLDYAREGDEEDYSLNEINALIQETVKRFRIREYEIESDLELVPPFYFRKEMIRRVLNNLLDNALRYGKIGVRIETRRITDHVRVTVSDEGPGIKSGVPDDLKKPFKREDISRSEHGAGLGLAIVDRMIRFHRGKLSLESPQKGGFRVTFELPLHPQKSDVVTTIRTDSCELSHG